MGKVPKQSQKSKPPIISNLKGQMGHASDQLISPEYMLQ